MEFEDLKIYFWDIDFEELSIEKYPKFIIERILNFGKEEEIEWLRSKVDEEFFKNVAMTSRRLDRKTSNYWVKHFGREIVNK